MKWTFLILGLIPCIILLSDGSEDVLEYATDTPNYFNSSYFEYFYDLVTLVAESNEASFQNMLDIAVNITGAFFPADEIPNLPQDTWWGEGENGSVTEGEIRPFQVNFTDDMIQDLRSRLSNRKTFKEPLEGANNTYGMNSNYLNTLLDYWMTDYDFKAREDYFNTYPQYIVNVQGLDIHYIHIKQENSTKTSIPILLLHGWPVTPFEYSKVIPYLMTENSEQDFVFEIIVPSLPGFAYSQATNKKGLAPYQVGIIFKNLMSILGHSKFFIHAGDVGHWVGSSMAVLYQDDILGFHTNFVYSPMPQTVARYLIGGLYPSAVVEDRYASRMYTVSWFIQFILENFGYYHMHATRPDTIGIALRDSPSALAAWIIQLVMSGVEGGTSNLLVEDGNLPTNYDDIDDIFDILTIYWATQCYTSSARLYSERTAYYQDRLMMTIDRTPTKVPYTALRFAYEIFFQPDSFLQDKYPNLVSTTTLDYGGHFAGFEHPDVLANSIWTSVGLMRQFNTSSD